MTDIDWSKQHCGIHQAPMEQVHILMPEVGRMIADTFPCSPGAYTWDVKVHMLFPGQYGCIPNWHQDFVPRADGRQRFDQIRPELPMYLWVSGPPLTEFRDGFAHAQKWIRFTQADEHRGVAAADFCWRGFIRAVDKRIQQPKPGPDWSRRHCQVYVDAATYKW